MKTSTIKVSLLLAGMMIPQIAAAQQTNKFLPTTKTTTMENNKAIVKKLYETVLNNQQFELLLDFVADTFEGPGGTGVEGFRNPFRSLYNGFPDLQWTLVTLVSEGDKVVVRWKWTGTHKGVFRNVPATGKVITGNGVSIYELKNGKIVTVDAHVDRFGILQSLGALPADIAPVKP
ncbi:MAG: ester cyclase [Chitinophaga sp.]|uniref:ester cyclase n=1 Tax=Chitinophaga sp. TaxID=1869181 RepID=UPI001B21DB69|nr:ester cyclase [Chitinophaga sp.]MBO9732503.1 ester cyclase [Chitinophaga sp.]